MQLIVNNLFKKYGKNEVLKGCSYIFEVGKITGLLGRNGSGKTTLFNILNQELEQENGDILILENNETREITKEDIGMVHSENFLPEYLTGYEFVKFLCEVHIQNNPLNIQDYFDMVLFDKKDQDKLIKDYSDGMKSKLSIISILISKPKIILLDEPLTAVDLITSIQIKKMLLHLAKNHILILSTHILQLAKDICDEVVILNDGLLNLLDSKSDFESDVYHALKGDDYV